MSWFKRKEPDDGRKEKREGIQKKEDAIETLMESLNREERRKKFITDFEPERRHA